MNITIAITITIPTQEDGESETELGKHSYINILAEQRTEQRADGADERTATKKREVKQSTLPVFSERL